MSARIAKTSILSLSLVAAAPLAFAEDVKLTATEIADLLRGRTAVGSWQGKPYRQYFTTDGSTVYASHEQRSAAGKWRVDPARDFFESQWEGSDWAAWGIIRRDGELYWTAPGMEPEPFEILDGQDLVDPGQR